MTWCTSTCLSPSPASSWLQSTPRTPAEVKQPAVYLVLGGQFTQMKQSFVLQKQRKKTATRPSPVSLIFLLNRKCWCQHTVPLVFERFPPLFCMLQKGHELSHAMLPGARMWWTHGHHSDSSWTGASIPSPWSLCFQCRWLWGKVSTVSERWKRM